ncbi:MAG: O-antigen ligase family protein [Candidatus Falkowbacteria bacterium]
MKFLNKTIEYGLYLLVFLLSVQTRWIIKAGVTEYATYSLYGTDVLLLILLVLSIIAVFTANSWIAGHPPVPSGHVRAGARNDKISNDRKICWFISGLLLMSAVSVFFAANRPLALYKLGWLILGIGLFWLVKSANYDRLKLIYTMLTAVFLQAILGSWQFLTQSSFANKWLGIAFHNGADLGTSVIEAVGTDGVLERWLRAYGGTDHPNIFGGVMAAGILLVIYLILADAPSEKSPALRSTPWLKGLIIIFTAALFFSFSRTAWLGLAIGLTIIMALAVVGRNLKRQKGLAEIILVMGILLFVLFSQYQNLITSRLGSEGRLENKSISERLVSYQESWQMIKNNWVVGVGLGNYTYALNRQTPNQKSFYYQPTHNVFLLVWSEIGIVGLLFFVGVIIFVFIRLRSLSRAKRGICVGYALRNDSAILIALVVIMTFDHWLFSLHFGVLFFWLVIGLATRSP